MQGFDRVLGKAWTCRGISTLGLRGYCNLYYLLTYMKHLDGRYSEFGVRDTRISEHRVDLGAKISCAPNDPSIRSWLDDMCM